MKKILLVLLLIPAFSYSQSKKKKKQAEENTNGELVMHLKSHIQYLADDKLEGRRAGSKGEDLAMQYIIDQYTQIGLEPKGTNGFIQAFEINEGKQVDEATALKVEGRQLRVMDDYIPLAFSAGRTVSGSPAMALNESRQPWFIDLKETLEENKSNPHFDIEDEIKKESARVSAKGATALFLYNTSTVVDNIQFNKNDKSPSVKIPVIYITREGYEKYFTDHSATLPIELTTRFSDKIRRAKNIVGYIDNHAANTVILGAHYDHLGYGEDKNALDTGHIIHNGADDNASGTAAIIELARMLKNNAPVNNNYLVINFSGEELGLFGSKYWIEHPSAVISPNYMINMDMVGRYDASQKLTIGGYGTSPLWSEILTAEKNNLLTKFDSSGSGPSDHATFYRKNIPVLFLFTGSHSDYHKATDEWNKINYSGERDIVKMVYHIIESADTKGKFPFTKTTESQSGIGSKFTVSLGIMPDYGFNETGVRADAIIPGRLAEKIGLKAGDVLVQLGEYTFADVYKYTEVLSKFKKGDATQLRIKRGREEKVFDIVF